MSEELSIEYKIPQIEYKYPSDIVNVRSSNKHLVELLNTNNGETIYNSIKGNKESYKILLYNKFFYLLLEIAEKEGGLDIIKKIGKSEILYDLLENILSDKFFFPNNNFHNIILENLISLSKNNNGLDMIELFLNSKFFYFEILGGKQKIYYGFLIRLSEEVDGMKIIKNIRNHSTKIRENEYRKIYNFINTILDEKYPNENEDLAIKVATENGYKGFN